MKIKSSSYRIEDDFGLQIEIKPFNKDIESKEVEDDVTNFFSKYRIISAYKPSIISNSQKELIERHQDDTKDIFKDTSNKPLLANELTMIQRIYIIRKMLPVEFRMKDFVEYILNNEFNGGKYSEEDARHMWSGIYQRLVRQKKIEIINKGASKNEYKYRYIGTDTLEEVGDIGIKKLMNGEKVVI